MFKQMKKPGRILSIFLAMIIMISGMAPTSLFADPIDEMDCAYVCSELGILRGEGDGVTDEYLAKESTRIQAAYLTLRLVGKEDEAENFTGKDNFDDLEGIYAGGQRRAAYLKAHSEQYGWQGDGTNKLMPNQRLTAQQFYKVLLTVLGYVADKDFPYEDTLDYAEEVANMYQCRYITAPLTNDDIAVMLVEAMMADMKDETYTLAEFLAEEGVIDYEKAVETGVITSKQWDDIIDDNPEDFTVLREEKIIADNFAEIDIVFNQKIDNTTVDRNYIKVDELSLQPQDTAMVLADGKTLRLYRETGFVTTQGTKRTVSVSRIKSMSGILMNPIMKKEITFQDTKPPELLEVTSVGLKRVKLVFSEPLKTQDSAVKNYATYKFNGRVMLAAEAAVCFGRELYLSFSNALEKGQNTLSIESNRIYDLANFPILDVNNYIFEAQEDLTPPQVLDLEVYREKAIVTFSEEVKSSVKFYWLDGNIKRYAVTMSTDLYDRNKIVFNFTESQYLPVSSVDVVVEGIVDLNGNTAQDYRTSVAAKFDTTRPEVTNIIADSANEIVVEFSKPVKVGTSNSGRFTLKNSNNITVSLNVQSYMPDGATQADMRYIKLTGSIPVGTYSLTIMNVEDTTAQMNRSQESVHAVEIIDKAPPTIMSVSAKIAESKVVLNFNKILDWASASDLINYQYNSPGRGHVAMPSGTSVQLESDNRTVVIQLPVGGWVVGGNTIVPNAFSLYIATAGTDEIRVLDIADTLGNKMEPTVVDVPNSNEVAAKLLPTAYAISKNRIMMRFGNGALPINAYEGDFIIRSSNQNVPIKQMGYNSINTTRREIYFDLVDGYEINTDGSFGNGKAPISISMVVPASVSMTKTALGTPLEIEDGISAPVVDNIRPGLLEVFRGPRVTNTSSLNTTIRHPELTGNQILIVLDELVSLFGFSNLSQLNNMIDVRLESRPTESLNPNQYTVQTYNDYGTGTTVASTLDTRMLVVTLNIAYYEAINVSVHANIFWDGSRDADNQYVMNNSFDTGFLPVN